MADFKMSGNTNLDLVCEVHDCELLPLYCMDCDCPLCGDCVTRDHVGHQVRKVSEVIETQVRQLEECLDSDNAVLFLQKILSDSQSRQKQLAENSENLLRTVLNREEELIEKAKLWREKMSNRIITLADEQVKSLGKDMTITSALLGFKDKGQEMDIRCDSIKLMFLNHGLKNILTSKGKNPSDIQSLDNFEFRIGLANDGLFELFGYLVDRTEELSSDTHQEEEEEEEEEEEFYDSLDTKMTLKFKLCQDAIDQIVPLQNSKTLLLIKGMVYEFDKKKGELNHRSILSRVQQITLIPSTGDVLSLRENQTNITRIYNGSLVTTYVDTNSIHEMYDCIGPAGEQAYACIVHTTWENKSSIKKLSLLDEFGRLLMSFILHPGQCLKFYSRVIFVSGDKNSYILLDLKTVDLVDKQDNNMKVTKSYAEGVGTRPSFTFSPNDIAADHLGNLLVAVPNDNAIHLLDKNLTFKKLLMTEEDGLRGPTSVALDTEGYLYVGCKNNHIHVVNYQYFLSTNRLSRLKIDMKQF